MSRRVRASGSKPGGSTRGIWIMNGFSSPTPTVMGLPAVAGAVQAYRWYNPVTPSTSIERPAGTYKFTAMLADLAIIAAAGKMFAIAIQSGNYAPPFYCTPGNALNSGAGLQFVWAPQQGASGHGQTVNIPIPWDTLYLSAIDALAQAVVAAIAGAGLLNYCAEIKIEGVNIITEETRMPSDIAEGPLTKIDGIDVTGQGKFTTNAPPVWAGTAVDNLGHTTVSPYRPALMQSAFMSIAASWARAFPGQMLSMPTLKNGAFVGIDSSGALVGNGSSETTQEIAIAQALCAQYGKRFSFAHTGLRETYTVLNTPMAAIIAAAGGSMGMQFDNGEFDTGGSGTQANFDASWGLAIASNPAGLGVDYFEIWPSDPLGSDSPAPGRYDLTAMKAAIDALPAPRGNGRGVVMLRSRGNRYR